MEEKLNKHVMVPIRLLIWRFWHHLLFPNSRPYLQHDSGHEFGNGKWSINIHLPRNPNSCKTNGYLACSDDRPKNVLFINVGNGTSHEFD